MKNDIRHSDDIRTLVDDFYSVVCEDDMLKNIFVDVMNVNWQHHLPKMYLFWEKILFGTGDYEGRPFPPHVAVHQKVNLTPLHFERWLSIFESSVDKLFEGPKADEIKWRARTISTTWSHKFLYIHSEKE
ncbi:MAG: group III truncated hemoglobin [Saprospiraceae bacterium]